jgi:tetratricopeptide (TPR) repeat protein
MRWVVIIALILGSHAAVADDKPWEAGVPAAKQDAALALYKEGNAFFAQDQFKEALEKYVQALQIWDHPAIRYNAAVCNINLDRPLDAYEDLEAALRYGEPPLGADLYKQGLSYQKLLAGRIADVTIAPKQAAKVTLDGHPLPTGTVNRHVLIGDHQVVAEKPGYQTETKPVHVNAGDHVTIVIEMHAIDRRVLERRYPRWVPWAVVSAGGAIALAGVPLLLGASSAYNRYDAGISASCPSGCPPAPLPSQVASDRSHGNLLRTLGYSAFGVGGALVASGVALIVLNQPRLVMPAVGADSVGLVISGNW